MAGEGTANAAMLALARESRGMTQAEVASAMSTLIGESVSQAYVSKAEAGRIAVGSDRLEVYAAALRYPAAVLGADPEVHGIGVGLVYHRKKASVGAKVLRRVHAELVFSRMQVRALLQATGAGQHQFRRVALGRLETPEDRAEAVRVEWGLGLDPIPTLVTAVEAAGGLVIARDLGADGLDAVTQWTGTEPPLFLADVLAPTDRFRFSLAHEIGHVFLHGEVGGGTDIEREANTFGAALLLPAEPLRDSFSGPVDVGLLLALKQRWGASMAALALRALTLDAISDWQYRQLMIEMSALGYRKREPGRLPAEKPCLVNRLAAQLVTDTGSLAAAAAKVGLVSDEFRDLYLSSGADTDPSLQPTR